MKVIVIGAGIVGAAASYFLTIGGADVVVLEAQAPYSGATGASDGAVSVASKRPGPIMEIARQARDFYVRLAGDGRLAGLYHPRPTFLLAQGDSEAAFVEQHGRDLASTGEYVRDVDRAELRRVMPGLSERVTAALEIPGDGHAVGYEVAGRLLELGKARLRRNTAVRSIDWHAGSARCILDNGDVMRADAVVIAAGVDSLPLMQIGDVLTPRKGQLIVTDRAVSGGPPAVGHMLAASYLAAKRGSASASSKVALAIDPLMTGQFLIGGSRENGCAERTTDIEIVSEILRLAVELYPSIAERRVIRTFAGIRAASVDGLPLLGRHPHMQGVYIATGFEGDGICLGPLMGSAIADLILREEELPLLAPLNPARFAHLEAAKCRA